MTVDRPFVTIAIVSSDDEARIESCLRCALAQDYPRDRLEVLVADGMSMDATREIVLRVAQADPRVRLFDSPHRTRAAGLNTVLAHASGEILVPMDPSGEYGLHHVSKCAEALSSPAAEHVAVVPRTAGRTIVERALSAVQKTRFSFTASSDLAVGSEPEPAVLGAVKRDVLDRVGPFDDDMRAEEDVDLARRIAEEGGTMAVRNDIVVFRPEGASFKDLWRRHYRIGESRAKRTLAEGRVRDPRTLAPLGMVAAAGALLATSSIQPITPIAAVAYAIRTGRAAVRLGREEGLVTIPIAWAAFPVMHAAHGLGFGAALAKGARAAIRGRFTKKR